MWTCTWLSACLPAPALYCCNTMPLCCPALPCTACPLGHSGLPVLPAYLYCRIGGRIHTHTLCAGDMSRRVDLGASFICGKPAASTWFVLVLRQETAEVVPEFSAGQGGNCCLLQS